MAEVEKPWGETLQNAQHALELVGALGGLRPIKPRPAEAPAGTVRMKRTPVPELKQANIATKEGSAEWHTEVVTAVINNQSAPKIESDASRISAAKIALATPETQKNVKFLLEGGVPKSDLVAVVAADIAASSFRDDPVYLVAKEAQLVHSLRSDMVISEQVEIGKAAKQLHERISMIRDTTKAATLSPPEYIKASNMVHQRMISVIEEKVIENRENPSDSADFSNEEESIDKVYEDLKESISEILVGAVGGDVGLEARIRLMNIPDDAAAFLTIKLLDNTPLAVALKEYALEVGSVGNIPQHRFVIEVSDILGDPSIKQELLRKAPGLAGGLSGGEVWDTTKVGLSGNPALDAYLEKLQHMMDTTPKFKDDPRRLRKALEDLQDIKSGFTAAELSSVGDPQVVLDQMAEDAEQQARDLNEAMHKKRTDDERKIRQQRGEDINEQFSTMFLNPSTKKLTILYPELTFAQVYNRYNEAVGRDTRGPVAQQMQRQLGKVVEYYSDNQFIDDIKQLMADPEHPEWRKEIETATGTPIERDMSKPIDGTTDFETDLSKITEHPFYKDRVDRLRELARKIRSKDNIGYLYGVVSTGKDIKKVQVEVAGATGDKGMWDAKSDGGYLVGMTNHIIDDFGDIAKKNPEKGHKVRIGEKEMVTAQFNTQYILEANKADLDVIHKEHYESRATINLKDTGEGKHSYKDLCKMLGIENIVAEFNTKTIEAMVRDAQKLNTTSLREVYHRVNSLSPGASDAQNFQPAKYAAESGLAAHEQARQMYEFLMERWNLLDDPFSQIQIRIMAQQYAEVSRADKAVKIMVDQAMKDPAYKLKIASDALEVHEVYDDEARRARVARVLKTHFTVDLKGYPIKNPPTSLEGLTRAQLTEVLKFKEGLKYADLVIGGYGYEGATWVCHAKGVMYDLIYGKDAWTRGIGVGDYKRLMGAEFTGVESDHAREEVVHKLIHGADGKPGILHVQGEFATTRSFQDLIEHNHFETLAKHRELVNGHYYEGLFTDIKTLGSPDKPGTRQAVVIDADRPDLAIQYMKITDRMTDEFLSFEKIGGDPINWLDGLTPVQDKVFRKVCKNMGVNPEKYIKLKKELATFVTQEPQLERLAMFDMIDTFIDVQDLESREKFLDSPNDAPGSKYAENRRHADANVIDTISGMIGEESGISDKCGIARVIGDNGTAQGSASQVQQIIGMRKWEPLLKALPELKNSILFTYGSQFASRGVAVVGGSWMEVTAMDRVADWGIYGSLLTKMENSIGKRVTHNTGDGGDLATTVNERHHMWSDMQMDVKDAFGAISPEMNLYQEMKMGLAREYIGLDGKHHHDELPLYIYQNYLILLGILGLGAIKTVEEGAEGIDQGMGGSQSKGGGGGAHH